MASDDFRTIREAVEVELRRALQSTEPALRRAVGDETPVTEEDRWMAMSDCVGAVIGVVVKLGGLIDYLNGEIEKIERRLPPQ